MIRELQIKNLALIENLSLEFCGGFSVFTGETGAGKSILIGAIGLLLGERASSEMIRSGCDDAEVCGFFEIENIRKKLRGFLSDAQINAEDNTLIIRRIISRSGKNKIHINQIPVPLSSLKTLGDLLIDLHGQHEHQSLLNEETHIDIIDAMPQTASARASYAAAYSEYVSAKNELANAQKSARELAEKKEILEFQHKELAALNLQKDEENALEQELSLLSSSAERIDCAKEILKLMGETPDAEGGLSLQKKLAQIKRKLETLSKYDPSVAPYANDMESIIATCSDLDLFCNGYLENIGTDNCQTRIEEINSRLSKIQRLKKKYSCDLCGLIEKFHEIENKLSQLENSNADITELQKRVENKLSVCMTTAQKLTASRKQTTLAFDAEITRQMKQLGFQGGVWKTELTPQNEPTPFGLETIRFLVQTNVGEPFLPLAKSASGGEVSRLMLAIKSIVAEHDEIPILIFDEIDTGIGGELANVVAKALYSLSATHQVLCISHLHQIASAADNHYLVSKQTLNNRTITEVRKLTDNERKTEIARMLGGVSDITTKHAEELLKENRRV